MKKIKCTSKDELIKLLNDWLLTGESIIGNGENKTGNTKWILLNLNDNTYYINADTTRVAIAVFVKNNENNYTWKVILNNRNVYKKVTNDLDGNAIKGLYFYSEKIGERVI